MKHFVLLLVSLTAMVGSSRAQDDEAKSIVERFAAVRPGPKDLAVYGLDWAASLEEARNRSTREKRPVLLVIIHAQYGDLRSGHC